MFVRKGWIFGVVAAGLVAACGPVAPGEMDAEEAASAIGKGDAPGPISNVLERSFRFDGHAYVLQDQNIAVMTASGVPSFVGHILSSATARRVELADRTLYVANDSQGVNVYDVASPSAPVLRARLAATAGYATNFVKVVGSYLFATESKAVAGSILVNLRAYQLSQDLLPVHRKTVAIGPSSSSSVGMIVALGTSHIGVSFYTDGVKVFDVTNPPAGMPLVSVVASTAQSAMVYRAPYLYVQSGLGFASSRLKIWDLSLPVRPLLVNQIVLERAASDHAANMSLTIRSGRTWLFLGGSASDTNPYEETLITLDVTSPWALGTPSYLPLEVAPGRWLMAADIDADGATAWVGGWEAPVHFPPGYVYRLARVDITDPANPRIIDATPVPTR